MTTLRLYGKKPRCLWCGQAVDGELRQMSIEFRGKQFEAIVCSQACESQVTTTIAFIQRTAPFFIGGMVLGLLMVVSSIFGRAFLPVMAAGMLVIGATIVVFPFVTPQTNKIFGMQKGLRVGRILGVVFLLGTLGFLASQLFE